MLALCETVGCRRRFLLAYFGEQRDEPCGNCDTCLDPPQSWDGTVAAQKLLSTVHRLRTERNQGFGAGQTIDILLGRTTDKVTRFRHDQLSVFGVGTDLPETQWRAVVRQLLAQGLLAVEGEHGTLGLTAASAEVLRGQREVPMRRDPERSRTAGRGSRSDRGRVPAVDLPPQAQARFEALRAWRAATAKEQGVPPYVVFHDTTLREIATRVPDSRAALASVAGVGEAKLARYAEGVLAVLAAPIGPVVDG
jgi:ATP-dependent DNA helicase RecQ